jgi:hypothetical protein
MKPTGSARSVFIPPMTISIGRGERSFGLVSLVDSGDLQIDGDAARITRLLASMRRMPGYRDLTNEEFFASIPEALCDGSTWAIPVESLSPADEVVPG